jgi:hypothetical protein
MSTVLSVSPSKPLRDTSLVTGPRSTWITGAVAYLARLRFPVLFGITATLLVVDLLVPDVVPAADEILLGLATALLASWRKKHDDHDTTISTTKS